MVDNVKYRFSDIFSIQLSKSMDPLAIYYLSQNVSFIFFKNIETTIQVLLQHSKLIS